MGDVGSSREIPNEFLSLSKGGTKLKRNLFRGNPFSLEWSGVNSFIGVAYKDKEESRTRGDRAIWSSKACFRKKGKQHNFYLAEIVKVASASL